MKISTFYDHVASAAKKEETQTEEMLERVKDLGFSGLEIDYSCFNNDLVKIIKASGMETSGVYILCDRKSIDSKCEKERFLYDAATLGARKVMIVPKLIKNQEIKRTIEELHEICNLAKSYSVKVTVENFDYYDSPCCGVENLRKIFDSVPELGWTFDTGNFIYCGQDALEAFESLKEKLSHCHIKDRRVTPLFESDKGSITLDGKTVYPSPAGEGILRIKECLTALESVGYDDYIAIEHFGTDEQWAYIRQDAYWGIRNCRVKE